MQTEATYPSHTEAQSEAHRHHRARTPLRAAIAGPLRLLVTAEDKERKPVVAEFTIGNEEDFEKLTRNLDNCGLRLVSVRRLKTGMEATQ